MRRQTEASLLLVSNSREIDRKRTVGEDGVQQSGQQGQHKSRHDGIEQHLSVCHLRREGRVTSVHRDDLASRIDDVQPSRRCLDRILLKSTDGNSQAKADYLGFE